MQNPKIKQTINTKVEDTENRLVTTRGKGVGRWETGLRRLLKKKNTEMYIMVASNKAPRTLHGVFERVNLKTFHHKKKKFL